MKALLKSRSGSLTLVYFGLIFALLLIFMIVVECGGILYSEDYANSVLQRAANSAVEGNMDDSYRADRILILKTEEAEQAFKDYVAADFPQQFTVTVEDVTATASPASLEASGTVRLKTVFAVFGFEDLSYHFTVTSTNYDLH